MCAGLHKFYRALDELYSGPESYAVELLTCHATGDSTEHYMVPIDKPRPPRAVEQTEGGGERGTDDALRPEGSLLDERACSVPEVRLDTAQTRELPKVKSGKSRAPKMATPPGRVSGSTTCWEVPMNGGKCGARAH